MPELLVREVQRRNPFRPEHIPWIARIYSYPFNRWSSLGRQALFGAPNFLAFYLYQKIGFLKAWGEFSYFRDEKWQPIRFDARNTQFSAIYMKAFAAGYESHIAAIVDVVVSEDSTVYDIGSNWGWLSLLVASKPGFKGQIHAFEPYAPSFMDLQAVVSQSQLGNRIQCHNLALSDEEGKVRMRLPDSFQSGQAAIENATDANGDTKATTVDALKLPPPTLMKIDVEGAEARVFGGAKITLATHKPMIVFESGRRDDNPIETLKPLKLLESLGYRFFHLSWLRSQAGVQYLVGDDIHSDPQPAETLALQEFHLGERFLRPSGMNIFACHQDRLTELESKFTRKRI